MKNSHYWSSVMSHVITPHVTPGFHGGNLRTICSEQYSAYIESYTKPIYFFNYILRLKHMTHLNQFALNC
jgi:hypothetical protein